jgi:hypothetical protein
MFTPISPRQDTRYLELAFPLSDTPVLYYLEIRSSGRYMFGSQLAIALAE